MVAKNFYKNGDHGLYSNRRGTPCGQLNHQTFIQNCGEDTVYEMFDHLLPNIVGPGNDGEFSSSLKPFSQVKCTLDWHNQNFLNQLSELCLLRHRLCNPLLKLGLSLEKCVF